MTQIESLLPPLSQDEEKLAELVTKPIDFLMGVTRMDNLPPADQAQKSLLLAVPMWAKAA